MSLGGDPDETVGKKPPLLAALSDPDEGGVDSAAVSDDSGPVAAVAADPVSAGAAPSLGTGLIMLLVPNSPTSSPSSRGVPPSRRAMTTGLRRDYGDLKRVWCGSIYLSSSNNVRTGTRSFRFLDVTHGFGSLAFSLVSPSTYVIHTHFGIRPQDFFGGMTRVVALTMRHEELQCLIVNRQS